MRTARDAILEYVDFYDFVLARLDRLIVVTFDEVTQYTSVFLDRVARTTGLTFEVDDLERLKRSAAAYLTRWSDERGDPDNVSLPRSDRDRTKAELRAEIRAAPRLREAQITWQRIVDAFPVRQ